MAFGWIVNGRQNRQRDAALRAERVRDVQRALYAEIRAYLAALIRDDIARYGARIAERIKTEPGYFPVIPTENYATLYSAIVTDIHVLPRATIDPVVLYYSQLVVIGAMIGDLRAIDIAKIGPERAADMYRDYIAMKLEALELGEEALKMMRLHLDGGSAAVSAYTLVEEADRAARLRADIPQTRNELREMQARLSSRVSDRSDR